MIDKLKNLLFKTTITSIYKKDTESLVFGVKEPDNYFQLYQKDQAQIDKLEAKWSKKFNSFGVKWDKERQLYRLFYDQLKHFYYSFYQLRINKTSFSNSRDHKNDLLNIELAGTNLCGMYLFGKKMIDLTEKKLNLTSSNNVDFLHKFSWSRNVLFEHNVNSNHYKTFILEPDLWSLASSELSLKVNIHTNKECEYYGILNYYQDYFELEKIIVGIINDF